MSKPQNDERVLRLLPVNNDSPCVLTPAQIACFNENGHVKPLDVFTPSEAEENRRYFDELLERTHERGRDSYSINGYHTTHAAIDNAPSYSQLRCGHPRREFRLLEHALFLQTPERRKVSALASGRLLLAADPIEDRHRLAGNR